MSDNSFIRRTMLVTFDVKEGVSDTRLEEITSPQFISDALDLILTPGDERAYVQEVNGLLAQHETECPMVDEVLGCCGGSPV